MGRSVNYLSDAIGVAYFTNDPTNENGKVVGIDDQGNEYEREPDEFDYRWSFDDLENNIISCLQNKYQSLVTLTKARWEGNEVRIFLENSHCEFGISEYCGLVSVSVRVLNHDYVNYGLAETWIKQNWDKMFELMKQNTYHNALRKVGRFSNGECVFEKF